MESPMANENGNGNGMERRNVNEWNRRDYLGEFVFFLPTPSIKTVQLSSIWA